jgi:vacuolar protein sorting-associated protein 13A/C
VSENSVNYIVICEENKEFPPYRIQNFTLCNVTVYQQVIGVPEKLSPYECMPYVWDQPSRFHKLVVEIPDANFRKEYSIDIFRSYEPLQISTSTKSFEMKVDVYADGPSRVLRLADLSLHPSLKHSNLQIKPDAKPDDPFLELEIKLAGIGLSLIDSKSLEEIIYATLDDIHLTWAKNSNNDYIDFTTKSIQIDHQTVTTPFPVILHILPHSKSQQAVKLNLIRGYKENSIEFLPLFRLCLGELDFKLEENLINRLVNFFVSNDSSGFENIFNPFEFNLKPEEWDSKKVYLEILHLDTLRIKLSFLAQLARGTIFGSVNPNTISFVQTLTKAIGITLSNLEDAQLTLSPLFLEHLLANQHQMKTMVARHYTGQLFGTLFKVVGSANILGSPISLFQNVSTGVYEFFSEPVEAIVNHPKEIPKALYSVSLLFIESHFLGFRKITISYYSWNFQYLE